MKQIDQNEESGDYDDSDYSDYPIPRGSPMPINPDDQSVESQKKEEVDLVWGKWSECSNSCGRGKKQRIKLCPQIGHCRTLYKAEPKHQEIQCYGLCKESTKAKLVTTTPTTTTPVPTVGHVTIEDVTNVTDFYSEIFAEEDSTLRTESKTAKSNFWTEPDIEPKNPIDYHWAEWVNTNESFVMTHFIQINYYLLGDNCLQHNDL